MTDRTEQSDARKQDKARRDEVHGDRHNPLPDNVKAMLTLYSREEERTHRWHRLLESIGYSVERPMFVLVIVLFVTLWIAANTIGKRFGIHPFDGPPFPLLQGIVTLGSLITATVVLAKQNRAASRERRQNHLQLQLTMLTEQKVAKLIQLVEELRCDLPMIEDRHDPEAETLKKSPHAQTVLDIIEEHLAGK